MWAIGILAKSSAFGCFLRNVVYTTLKVRLYTIDYKEQTVTIEAIKHKDEF